jgi:hypothetical protein
MTKWYVIGVYNHDLFVVTTYGVSSVPMLHHKKKIKEFKTRRGALRAAAKLLERGWLSNTGALTVEEYERKLIERDLLLTNLRSQT